MLTSEQQATLQELRPNYLVSKTDRRYWQKILRFDSQNAEAMYHVGLELEVEASAALQSYRESGSRKYLELHRKRGEHAYSLLRQSWRNGFVPAGKEVARIDRENRQTRLTKEHVAVSRRGTSKAEWLTVAVLFAILMVLIALLFSPFRVHVLHIFRGVSSPPTSPYAMQGSNSALGAGTVAELTGESASASAAALIDSDYPLWEVTTVLRSALYRFVQHKGYFPATLSVLTESFPNNYLTAIPKEPSTGSNSVFSQPGGKGGWVYRRPEPNSPLLDAVVEAVQPDLPQHITIPFVPISLQIDKPGNLLGIVSGDVVLRRYPVALGRDGSTPDGDLFVNCKVANPNQAVPPTVNPYGTRALELSDTRYAIHGTNDPASIGQNVSHGCVRLQNADAEELYALVPLFSPVHIGAEPLSEPLSEPETSQATRRAPLYLQLTSPKEEDRATLYTWGW